MGFNLLPGIPRNVVAPGLIEFVFSTLKCAHIEIYDKYLRFEDIQTYFPSARYRVVSAMVMDISGSEDMVFHRMDKNRRTNIKKAAKNEMLAEVASDDSFVDEFYNHLLEVFKRKELPLAHSKRELSQLIEKLAPTGGLLLARVRDPETGLPIASGIFPAFNGTMYISGVAALGSQVHRNSSEALYWFAIRYWRERGMTSFDMMGGGEYKRRYGAVEVPTHWIRVSRFGILMRLRDQAEKWMTRFIKFKTKYINR
jgi:lipid II:glycine glycyltransferase (peptidoglycan interpeptide bridge formation enzyme)